MAFVHVHVERAQPINTIFLKIELFTIWLYQISDVTAPTRSRIRININWTIKYSFKFKDMHTLLGLNNQDHILPVKWP